MEEFTKFANEALILEIVDALDDLEKAAGELKNEGLDQVVKKFMDLLKKYKVKTRRRGKRFYEDRVIAEERIKTLADI